MPMRAGLLAVVITVCAAAAASAQTPQPPRSYVVGVAQSAFGTVTSQSFGAEFGTTVAPNWQLFAEGGQIRDAAASSTSAGAQVIAAALTELQSAPVTYSVKEPVSFGVAGVRYLVPMAATRMQPYLLGGAGAARVKKDVQFQLGGSDASASLGDYVSLGTDLSATQTHPMLTFGGGVAVPVMQKLVLDVQYRYGRIFSGDASMNTNRAGVGFGVRF